MSNIAFIPARGNSKRFPKKNIALLAGKPLLIHTIDAAIESGMFDKIIVSSEDDVILRTVEQWRRNFVTIVQRDPLLSDDIIPVSHVCLSLLTQFQCKSFAVLLPTSPLRTREEIQAAYELRKEIDPKTNTIMSVSPVSYAPEHLVTISFNRIEIGEGIDTPRQQLEQYYRHDGVIIICDTKFFLQYPDFYVGHIAPYLTPLGKGIDIDTEMDLNYAEFLIWKYEGRLVNECFSSSCSSRR